MTREGQSLLKTMEKIIHKKDQAIDNLLFMNNYYKACIRNNEHLIEKLNDEIEILKVQNNNLKNDMIWVEQKLYKKYNDSVEEISDNDIKDKNNNYEPLIKEEIISISEESAESNQSESGDSEYEWILNLSAKRSPADDPENK